jgi:hypothetical protein
VQKPLLTAEVVQRFREEVVDRYVDARELMARARAERERERKRSLYSEAKGRFHECEQRAGRVLSEAPLAAGVPILVQGKQTSPRAITAQCDAQHASTERALARLRPQRSTKMAKRASR